MNKGIVLGVVLPAVGAIVGTICYFLCCRSKS